MVRVHLDVSYCFVMFAPELLTRIVISPESAELVEREEGMGRVPDLGIASISFEFPNST